MDKQRTIRRTVLAIALAALGATGTALADGTFTQPQPLTVTGSSVTVNAAIANPSASEPDVDYYAFDGKEGDVITIDIDGTTGGLNAQLFLFRPDGTLAFENWDSDNLDDGSGPPPDCLDCLSSLDPLIQSVRLDSSGTWIVAVSADPAYLTDQGAWVITPALANSNGSYTMIISGLSVPAPTPTPVPTRQQVNIDIKPRQAGPATIRLNAKGSVPVMLLSDSNFDPFTVDPASLRFGKTGEEYSYKLCAKEGWDLNRDGKPDRLCFFDAQRTDFTPTTTIGVLKGITGGRIVEGKGDLRVVGEKRARYERERNKYERKKHKRERHDRNDRNDRNDRRDRDDRDDD
jgi:hypothetical protein